MANTSKITKNDVLVMGCSFGSFDERAVNLTNSVVDLYSLAVTGAQHFDIIDRAKILADDFKMGVNRFGKLSALLIKDLAKQTKRVIEGSVERPDLAIKALSSKLENVKEGSTQQEIYRDAIEKGKAYTDSGRSSESKEQFKESLVKVCGFDPEGIIRIADHTMKNIKEGHKPMDLSEILGRYATLDEHKKTFGAEVPTGASKSSVSQEDTEKMLQAQKARAAVGNAFTKVGETVEATFADTQKSSRGF